jgi:hypothetical protein
MADSACGDGLKQAQAAHRLNRNRSIVIPLRERPVPKNGTELIFFRFGMELRCAVNYFYVLEISGASQRHESR